MIEQIIVSTSIGVGAVALDIAIKLGLDHGGWVDGDDPLPEKYRLENLPGSGPGTAVGKAVAATDGALFFIQRADEISVCRQIRQATRHYNRPLLIVDLDQEAGFMASRHIAEWVAENRTRNLYVDGFCDDAADPTFCANIANILEASMFLSMMETGVTSPLQSIVEKTRLPGEEAPPLTLDSALNHLEKSLSLKDKATIANMAAGELASLHFTLGDYINRNFDLFTAGSGLLTDCRKRSGRWTLAPEDAAAVIIRKLWERLRDTCRIRIVK